MPDEPAALPSDSPPRPLFTRTRAIALLGLLVVGGVGYALSWADAYRKGSYLVGPTDLDACIAIARRYDPDQAGVVWTKGAVKVEDRHKSHKVDGSWLFGLVQHFTEDGTIEAVGTKDGERRFRVTVTPGPFGIGWRECSYQFRPPAPEAE